jgi:hypothetical protein
MFQLDYVEMINGLSMHEHIKKAAEVRSDSTHVALSELPRCTCEESPRTRMVCHRKDEPQRVGSHEQQKEGNQRRQRQEKNRNPKVAVVHARGRS